MMAETSSLLSWDVEFATIFSAELAFAGDLQFIRHTHGAFALQADGRMVAWGDSSCGGDCSKVQESKASNNKSVYSTNGPFAALKADGSVVTSGDVKDLAKAAGKRCSHIPHPLNTLQQHLRLMAIMMKIVASSGSVAINVNSVHCPLHPFSFRRIKRRQQCGIMGPSAIYSWRMSAKTKISSPAMCGPFMYAHQLLRRSRTTSSSIAPDHQEERVKCDKADFANKLFRKKRKPPTESCKLERKSKFSVQS